MSLFDRFSKSEAHEAPSSEQSAEQFLERGMALEQQGLVEQALRCYEAAIGLVPELARAHFNRGNILLYRGDAHNALDAYTKAVQYKPGSAGAHFNLGAAYAQLDRLQDAVSAYQQAIALKPDFADAHFGLGCALEELGQYEQAGLCYRRILELQPDNAQVHDKLASLLIRLRRLDAAVVSYRRVLELRPDSAETYSNLGVALGDLGQLDDAVASHRRAIELRPESADLHFNFGLTLQNAMQLEAAIVSYRYTLGLDPAYFKAHCNLGIVLQMRGQLTASLGSYRKALSIQPDYVPALANLGCALKDLGELEGALASVRRALELDPDYILAHNNLLFILNYLGDHPASSMQADARRFGETVTRLARPYTNWPNPADPGRLLRVGFVSGDFRAHSVGYFVESVLAALSSRASGRLELFGYPTQVCNDAISLRIKACCHGWHSVMGLSDEAFAGRIQEDRIDILIDLSGHTAHSRLPVFGWRPAPVQASWLGYCSTTGVSEIDYYIADVLTLPFALESQFTETIWRLPESYVCLSSPPYGIPISPPPALMAGEIVFGSFNHLTKMTDETVRLWVRVLKAIPESKLFLKSKQLDEKDLLKATISRYTRHGIDPHRLILEGHINARDGHLLAYNRVDIALDPFPYNGVTTTAEALWMGVPVLTLAGERFLSRQGVGLLTNAGLPDWIATDPDDYVSRAVSHAGDLQRLTTLRAGLRQQVLASPIFDAPRFAGHFEAALRGMWQKWCARNSGARLQTDKAGNAAI